MKTDDGVLERFMKEFFPFDEFKEVGFFTEEMRDNYKAQADRVCEFFGYKTVYEYGKDEIRCHVSYPKEERPPDDPFITVIPSIYE